MFTQLLSLFFPRLCMVCGKSLIQAEKLICLGCVSDLPRSGYWLQEENVITRLFGELPENVATRLSTELPEGEDDLYIEQSSNFENVTNGEHTFHIEHASSFLYYSRESPYHQLVHHLKYYGESYIGFELGLWFGAELKQAPLYKTVEAIVPVPLHPRKERKRGYNQSLFFAQGIAQQTGWTLEGEAVKRIRRTASQALLKKEERQKNVAGAFSLFHPEHIAGKHILLVDDVLTTGATLQACASELLKAPDCKVSVASIVHIE